MSWYTKVSREESDKPREYPLADPGVYQFKVDKALFKTSSSGNPMIVLEINIYNNERSFKVFDYLVATEQMSWKIRHFCDAVGLEKQYEDDSFTYDMCIGRNGLADVGVQEAKPNPNGGMYSAKNVVLDYVMTMAGAVRSDLSVPHTKQAEFKDSDIPF